MKKQKIERLSSITNPFGLLSEEIIYTILDFLSENPLDKKSFSLTCKEFYVVESKHRKNLKILGQEHLSGVLSRYPNITHLDLRLCPRVTYASLTKISNLCVSNLKSIDLPWSGLFSRSGLVSLVGKCRNLVEVDVWNAINLKDAHVAALAEAKSLEKLWLRRCKLVTDRGVGCIAVGCKRLRLISLKWCFGVGDPGVGLIAVNCKEIRSLDLSYLPITDECLPSILKLQHLEDFVLEGCLFIHDDNLAALKHGCKSLKSVMQTSNWSPNPLGAEPIMEMADWRTQLRADWRQIIVNKMLDMLKRLLPFSGQEGLNELRAIARRFEDKIRTSAPSKYDYHRRILLKMLSMEESKS